MIKYITTKIDDEDVKFFYKFLRSNLPMNCEDEEYDNYIRKLGECIYKELSEERCDNGGIVVDHVLGGYQGGKACGLLKVPSCALHNNRAESDPTLHRKVLLMAVFLYIQYQAEKIKNKG